MLHLFVDDTSGNFGNLETLVVQFFFISLETKSKFAPLFVKIDVVQHRGRAIRCFKGMLV